MKFTKHNLKEILENETFIDNVCLSFRHDFGLLTELDKNKLRFECKEWIRAILNNKEDYYENNNNGIPLKHKKPSEKSFNKLKDFGINGKIENLKILVIILFYYILTYL